MAIFLLIYPTNLNTPNKKKIPPYPTTKQKIRQYGNASNEKYRMIYVCFIIRHLCITATDIAPYAKKKTGIRQHSKSKVLYDIWGYYKTFL